jgi:hypothetical protein
MLKFIKGLFIRADVNWTRVTIIVAVFVVIVVIAFDRQRSRVVKLRVENENFQEFLVELGNIGTKADYDHLSAIMDLSIEFHFDPTIVMIVDHHSRLNVDREKLAWSIIKDHEVMTHVALSLIKIESNGNTFATSNKKAYGLTQLLLPTARDYEPEITRSMLYDQETNVRIFFMHFERLLEHYEGNLTKVLHGWNRGEGTVDKLLARNIDPANGFSAAIYKVALTNNRVRLGF